MFVETSSLRFHERVAFRGRDVWEHKRFFFFLILDYHRMASIFLSFTESLKESKYKDCSIKQYSREILTLM